MILPVLLLLAQVPADSLPAIIPAPVAIRRLSGAAFTLTRRTTIVADAPSRATAQLLADLLSPALGARLEVRGAARPGPAIVLRVEPRRADSLGDEGYTLTVEPRRITIVGAAPAGVFYGMQTLRQLLPVASHRAAAVGDSAWPVAPVAIADRPRFAWRGAHLDAARHFMPRAFILRYLDLLALHKLNRFHWHLTDDQGWRLAIARYPRLTEVGGCRSGTLIGRPNADSLLNRYTTVPHCGWYTRDDVREIVAYAAARHITVVPEIEMPGHSEAAIAAYPWLGVTGRQLAPWRQWGVSENILMPSDSVVGFYQGVLEEVLALFPSPWIHIGGDEAVKTQWDSGAAVRERMRAVGARDAHEMQSWFIRQMDGFLTARGRRMIGWDEILEGGLAPNATVMSWRGTAGGIAAARAGHDVVMTPTSHTYLDYYQTRDTAAEPLRIGGYLPLATVYGYEPVPDSLTAEQARRILGVQGQLWSEYLPSPRDVEWQAFPRLTALAEVAWSPRARRNLADFEARWGAFRERLDVLDVHYWRPRR